MSSVGQVSTSSDYLSIKSEREPVQEMGKDQFMQLLVTQLKYQDPLNPMDNQEMMAQMAQFTALEQMKNVADASNKQLATSMVGKYVEYTYTDDNGDTTSTVGKVDHVTIKGSETLLGIGDKEITMTDVSKVVDSSNIQSNSSAFDVLGKTVQAIIEMASTDGTGTEKVVIEGEVVRVAMSDGNPYVIIGTGDTEVQTSMENVQNVVDKPSLTGKVITGFIINEDGTTTEVSGTVDYIRMRQNKTEICVNGKFVQFENITSVKNK